MAGSLGLSVSLQSSRSPVAAGGLRGMSYRAVAPHFGGCRPCTRRAGLATDRIALFFQQALAGAAAFNALLLSACDCRLRSPWIKHDPD